MNLRAATRALRPVTRFLSPYGWQALALVCACALAAFIVASWSLPS